MTYLTKTDLYAIMRLRLEEFNVIFLNEKSENPEEREYCVWGEANLLNEGELVTFEDMVEFCKHLATELDVALTIEYAHIYVSPWVGHIHKIYPPLRYEKEEEDRKKLEHLTGYAYKDIPGRYFTDYWVANQPNNPHYVGYGETISDLYIHLMLYLVKIKSNEFSFPQLPERVKNVKT